MILRPKTLHNVILITAAGLAAPLHSAEQIASFLLPQDFKNGAYTEVTAVTKSVEHAPFELNVTLRAQGQRADGAAKQMSLKSFSGALLVSQLSRFEDHSEVGMIEYQIDLAPIESHLKASGSAQDELYASLKIDANRDDYLYDLYVSYTAAEDRIFHTPIHLGEGAAAANAREFFQLARTASLGGVIHNRFVLYAKDQNDIDLRLDLSKIYAAGVRKMSIILASGDFGGSREIKILEESGVYFSNR